MKRKTQKEKVLALLQEGEVRETQLGNLGKYYSYSYRRWIHELRNEGYDIRTRITLEGTFYQLIGENKEDGHTTDNEKRNYRALPQVQSI